MQENATPELLLQKAWGCVTHLCTLCDWKWLFHSPGRSNAWKCRHGKQSNGLKLSDVPRWVTVRMMPQSGLCTWTSHRAWQAVNLSFEAILYTQKPFQKLKRKTGIRPAGEFLFFSGTNFVIAVLGQERSSGYTCVVVLFKGLSPSNSWLLEVRKIKVLLLLWYMFVGPCWF